MNDVSLEELLRTSFQSQMVGIYTSIPCIVIGNDNIADGYVTVQPSLNKRYKNEVVEEHPPILAVPLMFPASSTSAFTFPVNVGDTVLCVFSQRGLDTLKVGTGKFVTPSDFRKFDKRDAIAIPGLFPFSASINKQSNRTLPHSTSDAVIAHNIGTGAEVQIRMTPAGDVLIQSPTKVTVQCKEVIVNATTSATVTTPTATVNATNTTWTGDLLITGDVVIDGSLDQSGIFTLDGTNINSHVHSGVSTGPSNTGPPV